MNSPGLKNKQMNNSRVNLDMITKKNQIYTLVMLMMNSPNQSPFFQKSLGAHSTNLVKLENVKTPPTITATKTSAVSGRAVEKPCAWLIAKSNQAPQLELQ
jgi:hypothetical protein